MNKKEAIEKIINIGTLKINDTISHQQFDMVDKNKVLDIISQINEPKKPVVPKFVADWLEVCKYNKLTLVGAFEPVSEHGVGLANTFTGEVWKGIDWAKRNQDTFVRAWLDGYEVKKEKLYTVEIPNPNSKGNNKIYLCKDDTTGKVYLCKGNFNPSRNRNLRLTESEIKEDFDWAFRWAKEVNSNSQLYKQAGNSVTVNVIKAIAERLDK